MKPISRPPVNANRQIETPEGIILSMPLADPMARAVAFLIDAIVRGVLLFICAWVLLELGDIGEGFFLIIVFIVWWGYYVVVEMLMDGSSPGKKAMKLRVVNEDFTSINFSASLIRNLLRTADAFPGMYGMAIVSILFSSTNKRIGDIAAKTVVISTKTDKFQQIKLQETALIPTLVFTQAEQQTIIEFARFYEQGATDRAKEIAQYVSQPLNEPDTDKLVITLRRLYNK